VPLSMTLSRTGALVETSSLARADIALAASPSIEPTATVSVTGRASVPIGKETCACRKDGDADKQEKAKPSVSNALISLDLKTA
jgi:hypothetical protein